MKMVGKLQKINLGERGGEGGNKNAPEMWTIRERGGYFSVEVVGGMWKRRKKKKDGGGLVGVPRGKKRGGERKPKFADVIWFEEPSEE